MKWKATQRPEEGEMRWRHIFAWRPHRCSDGYWRWLCDLYVHQRFQVYDDDSGWLNLEYIPTDTMREPK